MPTITNFSEAQAALRPFYTNARTPYTLTAMQALMQFLDNPQERVRVVHVAGTSGKTSTSYYCAALLRAQGFSVGLSVSPHVDNLNERLQINGQPLAEAEFCALLAEFLDVIARAPLRPSYFELLTAMAFWEYARRGLDYAVMEVGLGGLLDATNVITRADKLCLITDIGLDHTEILGDTLGKIAAQKAGIVQAHNQLYMYEQGDEVMAAVRQRVAAAQAELHLLQERDQIELPGLPLFQQRNLGLAVAAIASLGQSVSDEQLQLAARVAVPARLERSNWQGHTIIIDGSHNAQKLAALLGSIDALYPGQPIAAVVAFVVGNSERWQGGLEQLLPKLNQLILTSFTSEQDIPKSSVDPRELAAYCESQGFRNYQVIAEPAAAWQALQTCAEPLLLVTGSFYLLNHIRPLLHADV